MITKEVDIESIEPGDAIILRDGEAHTVSRNNIKRCSFMGRTIFGDSYRSGHKKVTKVTELHGRKL